MYDLPYSVRTEIRIFNDANSRFSEPFRSVFPEMYSDSASRDLLGRILWDMDNDTESTALWRQPRPTLDTFHPGECSRDRQTLIFPDETVRSFQWRGKKGLIRRDLAFHSSRREQRLTLKAGWSVLKKLAFFTWERIVSPPPPHFFKRYLQQKEYHCQDVLLSLLFMQVAPLATWNEGRAVKKKEDYLTKYIHYTLLPATWTFILLYHKGVLSPSHVLQNHFVWSMVCASPTPQNHKHWGWPLDPSPQQTQPYALLDCQNVDRNVLFFKIKVNANWQGLNVILVSCLIWIKYILWFIWKQKMTKETH